MRQLSALCFVAAAALWWLENADRTSSTALSVVEWSQRLGIPLFAIVLVAGVALLVMGASKGASKPTRRTSSRPSGAPRSAKPPTPSAIGASESLSTLDPRWQDKVRSMAQALELGKGARMTIDLSTTTPLTLHLEHLSPAHCKRAIAAVGSLVNAIPTPPRLKVVFDHCPNAGAPRHHQVAGALSQAMPRSQFRVVSHVDIVDVMFLHPDAAWSTLETND